MLYSLGTANKQNTTTGPLRASHEPEKRKWTVSTVGMFMNEADPCGFECARLPGAHSSKPCCPSTLAAQQQQQQHPPVQAGRPTSLHSCQTVAVTACDPATHSTETSKAFTALPSAPSSSRLHVLPGICTTGQSQHWTPFSFFLLLFPLSSSSSFSCLLLLPPSSFFVLFPPPPYSSFFCLLSPPLSFFLLLLPSSFILLQPSFLFLLPSFSFFFFCLLPTSVSFLLLLHLLSFFFLPLLLLLLPPPFFLYPFFFLLLTSSLFFILLSSSSFLLPSYSSPSFFFHTRELCELLKIFCIFPSSVPSWTPGPGLTLSDYKYIQKRWRSLVISANCVQQDVFHN